MASPRVAAAFLSESQASGETTANTYLMRLECFQNARVIDRDLATAPVSPSEGDTYITAGAGGGWTGIPVGSLVAYFNGWRWCPPDGGFRAFIVDEKIDVAYSDVESAWYPIQEQWSTTEHWTGQYREGSKVYSKSFTFSSVAGGLTNQAHGISSIVFDKLITAQWAVLNVGASVGMVGIVADLAGPVVGFAIDGTYLTLDYYGSPAATTDVKVRLTYCKT